MNNEAIKKIAENNGFNEASRQLFEEMAELTVALNKYYRVSILTPERVNFAERIELGNIKEEIADVTIMIEQIKYLLSLNSDDIDLFIEQKLNRQLERIDKNE